MATSYSKQVDENNILLLREILSELPQYVTIAFRGIELTTSTRTRLGYARDIKIFYEFLRTPSILEAGFRRISGCHASL